MKTVKKYFICLASLLIATVPFHAMEKSSWSSRMYKKASNIAAQAKQKFYKLISNLDTATSPGKHVSKENIYTPNTFPLKPEDIADKDYIIQFSFNNKKSPYQWHDASTWRDIPNQTNKNYLTIVKGSIIPECYYLFRNKPELRGTILKYFPENGKVEFRK